MFYLNKIVQNAPINKIINGDRCSKELAPHVPLADPELQMENVFVHEFVHA